MMRTDLSLDKLQALRLITSAILDRHCPDNYARIVAHRNLAMILAPPPASKPPTIKTLVPELIKPEKFSVEIETVIKYFNIVPPPYLISFSLKEGADTTQSILNCALLATLYSLALSPELRSGKEFSKIEASFPKLAKILSEAAGTGLDGLGLGGTGLGVEKLKLEKQSEVISILRELLAKLINSNNEIKEKFKIVSVALEGKKIIEEGDFFPFIRICIEAVTIGPIPNSIRVPRFEARIMRLQNIGSSPTTLVIP